jgi:hypothetical protein
MNRVFAALVAVVGSVMPVAAQTPRVEIAVGGMLAGVTSAGETNATLLNSSGGALTLFRTSNRITAGKGVEGLVSMRLRERLRVEVAFGWANADFESRISGDFEGAPDVSVTQGVQQFSGDVALVHRVIQRGRLAAFVRGGAGVFREVTSDRAVVDNGVTASLGGVTQFLVRQAASGLFGRVALRAEARLVVRRGGIEFGSASTRLSPVFVAGLVVGR